MTSYQEAELARKIEWLLDLALVAAHTRTWQEFDRYMAQIIELRCCLPISDARTIGTVVLKDVMEKCKDTKVQISIENNNLGLIIHPEGMGTCDGPYAPILLEQHEGMMRLFVWADINQQEPTDIIDLSTAMESNRRDTD